MKYDWHEPKRQKTLAERGLDFADIASVNWDEAIAIADTRRPLPRRTLCHFGFHCLPAMRLCLVLSRGKYPRL